MLKRCAIRDRLIKTASFTASHLLNLIHEIVLADNNLDGWITTRRKSDCGFENGGESSKLRKFQDALPSETLYGLNAKLLLDSGIEGQKGVFWYLDKDKRALNRRLDDLLDKIKYRATKNVPKSKFQANALKQTLQLAHALMFFSKRRWQKSGTDAGNSSPTQLRRLGSQLMMPEEEQV